MITALAHANGLQTYFNIHGMKQIHIDVSLYLHQNYSESVWRVVAATLQVGHG